MAAKTPGTGTSGGGATLERLCRQLQRAADEQRRQLARQLHDSTSQTLSAASMRLSLLEQELGTLPAPAHEALADVQALIADSVRELATLSLALHPPLLGEGGLAAALRTLAQRLGEGRLRLRLAPLPRLDPAGELAFYRLLEQTLADAPGMAFADGAAITAEIAGAGASVVAVLQGPPAPAAAALTMQSLRQRFRALGGSFHVRRTAESLRIDARAPAAEKTNGP
jgi:two-component system, NarL family, sensor kinase